MRRPGFLGEYEQHLIPKATLIQAKKKRLKQRLGLGAFGKGFIAPPPNVPAGLVAAPDAVTPDGKVYMQDPRCPAGEKMGKVKTPCVGQDCCDPSGCDPEGTVYEEEECVDDPSYLELPDEPPAGFKSCAERAAARYPEPCNEQTCPTCFAPKPAPQAVAAQNAEAQAELLRLQQEQQALQTVTAAPVQTYTGGGIPTNIPVRAAPRAPTAEEKIAQLVEAHEERKAMARASAPAPLYVAPPTRSVAPAASASTGTGVTGLFNWLSAKLFGTPASTEESELDGLGNMSTTDKTATLVAILAIAGLYYSYTKIKAPKNLQLKRKR